MMGFREQFPKVMRFYGVLILPIGLAFGAIVARLVRLVPGLIAAQVVSVLWLV